MNVGECYHSMSKAAYAVIQNVDYQRGLVWAMEFTIDGMSYHRSALTFQMFLEEFPLKENTIPTHNDSVFTLSKAEKYCECGAKAVGSPFHSHWCPLHS